MYKGFHFEFISILYANLFRQRSSNISKRVLIMSFSSLFPNACCNLSLPILEVNFIFIFSSMFSPSRPQGRGNMPMQKNQFKKNCITLKKKLDNYLVPCCYFLSPFPAPAQPCRLLTSCLFLVTPRMFRGVMRSVLGH